MMRKHFTITACITAAFLVLFGNYSRSNEPAAPSQTIINDQVSATRLSGDHFFALQWISWRHFGKASIIDKGGVWHITGRQDSRESDDYITIDGIITEINPLDFKFDGEIVTRVSHINGGKPCVRSGTMTFRISGKRQYWRLNEMRNPEDNVVDYIDIFFHKYE